MPTCSPSCNSGHCVNNNVCDCTGTNYKGLYCNEYYKLERSKYLDITIKIIGVIMTIASISLFIGLYIFRKKPQIKACNYYFF